MSHFHIFHWLAKAALGRMWLKPGLGTQEEWSAVVLTAVLLHDLGVKEMQRRTGRTDFPSVSLSSSLKAELSFTPTFSYGYLTYFEHKCFKWGTASTSVPLQNLLDKNISSSYSCDTANTAIKCTIIVTINLCVSWQSCARRRIFFMDLFN